METQRKQKEACRTLRAWHLGNRKTMEAEGLGTYVTRLPGTALRKLPTVEIGIYCADTALQRGKSHL